MDKELLLAIEGLKDVKRKGWIESGINEPESVADHTCGVSLCVLLASMDRKNIDQCKALSMALIHDLAESVVGDITPSDNVPKDEKIHRERRALEELFSGLSRYHRDHLLALWDEFGAGMTPEAKLVLDADIFERTVQAKIYRDRGEDVGRFFDSIKGLEDNDLKKILERFIG